MLMGISSSFAEDGVALLHILHFLHYSLVIKPYLNCSRAVLKIIFRASHAYLQAIFVVVIRVQAVFYAVPGP